MNASAKELYDALKDVLRTASFRPPLTVMEAESKMDEVRRAGKRGHEALRRYEGTLGGVPDVLVYECHITVKPVAEEHRPAVAREIEPFGFRLAELLMRRDGTPSAKDAFMTAHGATYEDVERRMRGCLMLLEEMGVTVWRYKIEAVVFDERCKPPAEYVAEQAQNKVLELATCDVCGIERPVSEMSPVDYNSHARNGPDAAPWIGFACTEHNVQEKAP